MELSVEATSRKKRVLDAEQQAKNRLVVKRCYYKKLNTLNELRAQVDRLESEYEKLLAAHHREHAQPTRPDANVGPNGHVVRNALAKENIELKRLAALHSTIVKQVEQLSAAHSKTVVTAQLVHEHKLANPTLVVNPLTLEQTNVIARAAYREVVAFRESNTRGSTGSNIFGWRDRHKVYPDKLVFSLEKVFPGCTVEEMTEGTWRIISHPDAAANLYTRGMKSRFHVTQQLDANTVIFHHTLERNDTDFRVRSFFLAKRVDLGSGRYMVFYRCLDPKRYLRLEGDLARDPRGRKKVEPQKEDLWMDAFIWGVFEPVGDNKESCKDEFGGVIQGTSITTPGWWGLEILQICMRIEAQVVGSQSLLLH